MFFRDFNTMADPDCCRMCMKSRGVRNDVFESRQDADALAAILERHLGIEVSKHANTTSLVIFFVPAPDPLFSS